MKAVALTTEVNVLTEDITTPSNPHLEGRMQ